MMKNVRLSNKKIKQKQNIKNKSHILESILEILNELHQCSSLVSVSKLGILFMLENVLHILPELSRKVTKLFVLMHPAKVNLKTLQSLMQVLEIDVKAKARQFDQLGKKLMVSVGQHTLE
jgi:hypothetical protein